MKATIDSNVTIYEVFQPLIDAELQESGNILRSLLKELSVLCESLDFISGGEIGSDIQKLLVDDEESYSPDAPQRDGTR